MHRIVRFILAAIAVWLGMSLYVERAYADGDSREYAVKAAFIYNFAQFVDWPNDAFDSENAPIVIGVLGENPFGTALEQAVQGKSVKGRSFIVKYFKRPGDLGPCHILFISDSETTHLAQIFQKVDDKPILTIGNTKDFPWAGGVIRFYSDENKLRFEISIDAADNARLKISSKLLNLARIFKKS